MCQGESCLVHQIASSSPQLREFLAQRAATLGLADESVASICDTITSAATIDVARPVIGGTDEEQAAASLILCPIAQIAILGGHIGRENE